MATKTHGLNTLRRLTDGKAIPPMGCVTTKDTAYGKCLTLESPYKAFPLKETLCLPKKRGIREIERSSWRNGCTTLEIRFRPCTMIVASAGQVILAARVSPKAPHLQTIFLRSLGVWSRQNAGHLRLAGIEKELALSEH